MFSKLSSSVRAHAGLSLFAAALVVFVVATLPGCPARGESSYSQEELRTLRQQNEQLQRDLADLKANQGGNSGGTDSTAALIAYLERRDAANANGTGGGSTGSDPALASSLESLRTEVRAIQADYRALTDKYEALLTEVVQRRPVEEDLADAQKENENLRQQISQLDAERAQLNVLLAQNWTHLLEQLEAQSTSLDAQVLKDELQNAKAELFQLRADYDALQTQQGGTSNALTERDEKIEELETDNKDLREQVANLEQQIEDMQLNGVQPSNPNGNGGTGDNGNPAAGVIEGRIGQVSPRGDAIVIFPLGAEIRTGMTFNVLNQQGRKIATFKVTANSTPESITDAQWWGGIVTTIGNETVAMNDRVTNIAGADG